MRVRLMVVSLMVVLAVSAGFAAKNSATKLTALFQDQPVNGVSGDGNAYIDGIGGVQCYFGSAGKVLVVQTYNTTRKLHFHFDGGSIAWQNSGLPQDFDGTVVFDGVNYYGPWETMGYPDTTALIQGTLQFKDPTGVTTYELKYANLAGHRFDANTWRITSDLSTLPGSPFVPSDSAALSMIRKRGSVLYGTVNMPITFDVRKF